VAAYDSLVPVHTDELLWPLDLMRDGRSRLDLDELTGDDVSDDSGGSDGGLRRCSDGLLGRRRSPRAVEI
jgi:hypothetical protein